MSRVVYLQSQPAQEPGEVIVTISSYPLWATTVVTIAQAEAFVGRLTATIAEARAKAAGGEVLENHGDDRK